MIPQQFIDEVQAKTDIVELISSYIPLKRAGRNFKALCPFHGEKTPSFIISPQKQIFHCFGCGQGGGVIQFLLHMEKVSFVEAVEILAKRLGLTIPYEQQDKSKNKASLYDVVNEASMFFHKSLLEPNALPVKDYLNKRGINDEIIKKFRLGYAWGKNTLRDYLRNKGATLEQLEKASLAFSHEGAYLDLFRDRVMFPIFDARSRAVGFGARIWKPLKDAAKYINSLENPLYSKREHLFGLNFSKDAILKNDSVIVVEGYLDMIIPFTHGICNIVASLGTALTLEQIRLIQRFTSNIILVFDSDKAGQTAASRALDLLLENDLKVKVVKLPEGFDPDSMVRQKGKDYFIRLLEEKQDFFDYKLDSLKKSHDIESIEGKTKIVKEMFFTIDRLNSEVEKYEYIRKLSEAIKIKEEILISEFRRDSSRKKENNASRGASPMEGISTLSKSAPSSITEKVILKFMFTNFKALSLVKKQNVREEDFTSYLARKTVTYLFKNDLSEEEAVNSLRTIEDKEISSFVSEVLMDDNVLLDSKELFRDSIRKLRRKRAVELKDNIRKEIKEAETEGDKKKLKVLIGQYDKIRSEAKNG